ncbi:purine-cytosine permease family protein [Acetobacter conturbans]|uniref:Cytosine permease n=1 Tax=Acetobacter conturbans TaxID=1737472 RepID=A0ABX0JUY6_9PROT|nr:cytosine permease [Acetobacter conturbans]NHN87026.1 cytosine permease [Acetobacter conturbans]
MTDRTTDFSVEANSTSFVPLGQRHGRVRDLFTLWFTTNIAPLPIVTGATLYRSVHLPFWVVMVTIATGHMAGGLVLGACSAQGPQTGLPQMVQARAQFGRYGSLLLILVSFLLYLGFFTSNTALAGAALHGLFGGISPGQGSILAGLCAVGIGVMGYNTIHLINRLGFWFMATALAAGFVSVMMSGEVPVITPLAEAPLQASGFISWMLLFSTTCVWNISYSCYTSDYSRYLPPSVGFKGPFLASAAGAGCGASLSFIFGVLIAAMMPGVIDPLSAIAGIEQPLGLILMGLFVLNIVSHNALNVYGSVLTLITAIQTVFISWIPGRVARLCFSVIILAGSLSLVTLYPQSVVPVFLDIVLSLLIVLVPWVTINLCVFYFPRVLREEGSMATQEVGFDRKICLAFLVGTVVQIPFISNAFYTGPMGAYLHGINLGWLIATPVTAGVLFMLHGRRRSGSS